MPDSSAATNRRRPALIAVAVLGMLMAGWMAWPYLRGAPGPATEFTAVCVVSGELFTVSVEEAGIIPAPNPRTGAYTLLPIERGADNTVRIAERYRAALAVELADQNRVVDPDTFLVQVSR